MTVKVGRRVFSAPVDRHLDTINPHPRSLLAGWNPGSTILMEEREEGARLLGPPPDVVMVQAYCAPVQFRVGVDMVGHAGAVSPWASSSRGHSSLSKVPMPTTSSWSEMEVDDEWDRAQRKRTAQLQIRQLKILTAGLCALVGLLVLFLHTRLSDGDGHAGGRARAELAVHPAPTEYSG